MDVSPAELDPSFEPLQRARSNTWPLPRPDNFDDSSMSPTVTHSGDTVIGGVADSTNCGAGIVDNLGLDTKCGVIPELVGSSSLNAAAAYHCNQLKKGSSRRNAWGNLSYADLITQAINSSPEKRLTLSQIYEWMVHNVPYFKDKGDNNSSAGWKNSIRHNLSLHNRFMRVQNEGTGKSSWWMLNPDAKPGKSTRRRATSMETSKFEKRRGRVKKKVDALRNGLDANISPSSSVSENVDQFPDSPLLGFQPSPTDFRPRTSSNASSCGRLSPIPAVEAEWTMNYNGYIPPDQLAGTLEQRMKIDSGSDAYLYQNSSYQHQAAHSPAGVYSRSPFSQVTPASSQNCLIHQLQPCNCHFLTCDVKHNLSSPLISRSSNSSPAAPFFGIDPTANLLDDLNINIEQFPTDFECNVEEVLRHEISLGGSLDFNFPTSNLTTSNPSSIAHSQTSTAAAAAAAAAATVATSNNHGQPSFNDHSWVH